MHKSSIASQALVGLKICKQAELNDLKQEYNAELVWRVSYKYISIQYRNKNSKQLNGKLEMLSSWVKIKLVSHNKN